MSCLGVHYAIEPEVMADLLLANDDEARMVIIEDVEESGDYDEWQYDTDKAWDGIHRCLTDGKLEWENGEYPLDHVILGGKSLYEGDDYIICLIRPEQVSDVANALRENTEMDLRERYKQLHAEEYDVEIGSEDFNYLWENLQGLPVFFERAS